MSIIHPFQFESKSTQTVSEPKDVRLGGVEKTVFDTVKGKSITVVDGGVVMHGVTHRIRTGKTAKDKARGHIAGKKNRRIWSDDRTSGGKWVKV